VLDEVVCLEINNDPLIVISQTMGVIETRILEHQLLGRLSKASEEEIFFLKEQFGEETVDMGIRIIEAYASLNSIVGKLQGMN
jgi:hypothetical protein